MQRNATTTRCTMEGNPVPFFWKTFMKVVLGLKMNCSRFDFFVTWKGIILLRATFNSRNGSRRKVKDAYSIMNTKLLPFFTSVSFLLRNLEDDKTSTIVGDVYTAIEPFLLLNPRNAHLEPIVDSEIAVRTANRTISLTQRTLLARSRLNTFLSMNTAQRLGSIVIALFLLN